MVEEGGQGGSMLSLEQEPMKVRVHLDGLVTKQEDVHDCRQLEFGRSV